MKPLVALTMPLLLVILAGCGKKSDDGLQPLGPPANAPQAHAGPNASPARSGWKAGMPIPVYVTPFYNSDGPQVSVGPFSDQLKAANADTIKGVAVEMKKQWDTLPVEAMYVVAIRHYDLGQKDEAVYWFYAAQYRARLFQAVLSDKNARGIGGSAFEATSAQAAFQQLAGEYINGYAFGDLDKLKVTLQTVGSEGEKTMPRLAVIYPKAAFIPESSWPGKNKEVAAGLSGLADQITRRTDEIKATRKQNGIEGKY